MPRPLAFPLAVVLCVLALVAEAEVPRNIKWADLIPPLATDHPFAKLTRLQAVQLAQVAAFRERQGNGDKLSAADQADLGTAIHNLKKAGVDIDGLLAKRAEIAERNRA